MGRGLGEQPVLGVVAIESALGGENKAVAVAVLQLVQGADLAVFVGKFVVVAGERGQEAA